MAYFNIKLGYCPNEAGAQLKMQAALKIKKGRVSPAFFRNARLITWQLRHPSFFWIS